MLSGLFTSTLTQQVISYPIIPAESRTANDTATVDRATSFSAYDGKKIALRPYDTLREQQALFHGAFSVPTETAPQVAPVCSSGECDWPLYGSLAVCGDVVNLTAQGNEALLASLRNATSKRLTSLYNSTIGAVDNFGYDFVNFVPVFFPIVVSPLLTPSGAFNESINGLVISDSYIAYSNELMNNSAIFDLSKLQYLEIAFWWCTKTFSTKVKAGNHITTDEATRSRLKKATHTLNTAWSTSFYPCYTAGTCNKTFGPLEAELEAPPLVPSTESFTVHLWTALMGSALLAFTMSDAVLMDQTRGVIASNGGGIARAFALSILGDFLSTSTPPPATQLENVRNVAKNMARTMANNVREGATRFSKGNATAVVTGTVFTPQAYVRIHWGWMAMLATQLLLTALFLAVTILTTHSAHLQVMKSSSLATVCGLDEASRKHLGGISDFETLNKRAKCLKISLERGGSGIPLWLGIKKTRPENWQPPPAWRPEREDEELR
ncbi:hypothetical protein EDB81DRAFT_916196 [Dactylonectria macrodidyma]|uniref:Uncharacterized protein n=1 Tax=Dactylonectria macrodidyma TaxID=307937 RepID=A0A9P9IE42_9HYPO|nr:hypothetical protein EDB81DRAFT_916196 [Dactylonectria macrodidyma]